MFAAWIAAFGSWFGAQTPVFATNDSRALALGAVLIAVGQCLNVAVFYRLGATGVFYGDRFGRRVPWVRGFPFSVLAHPQYVGAVATIWGLFLAIRFPHPDWVALPLLETLYYAVGARFERTPVSSAKPRSPRRARRIFMGAQRLRLVRSLPPQRSA